MKHKIQVPDDVLETLNNKQAKAVGEVQSI